MRLKDHFWVLSKLVVFKVNRFFKSQKSVVVILTYRFECMRLKDHFWVLSKLVVFKVNRFFKSQKSVVVILTYRFDRSCLLNSI